MEATAKKGDPMQKTKDDCVANLKKLYPDIKDSDMKTIVHSIFNLLNVTDKVEAQHAKKRAPRKRSEQQMENLQENRHERMQRNYRRNDRHQIVPGKSRKHLQDTPKQMKMGHMVKTLIECIDLKTGISCIFHCKLVAIKSDISSRKSDNISCKTVGSFLK